MVKSAKSTSHEPTQTRSKTSTKKRPRIALILQGGGALGAYHIGAYQALEEAGYRPDWVSGISIGAINAAIIVGNEPKDRLNKLEELWFEISRPDEWGAYLPDTWRRTFNQMSAASAMLFGQPNFWAPRFPSPALLSNIAPEAASFCDTTPMHATLERLVNFDLINSGKTRLSLGATNIGTGDLEFFDNWHQPISADHVLASGSLPPGFPATRIGNDLYWDGGCVSNTPLNVIYEEESHDHILVFMIDLWSASGPAPTSMDEVGWRQKQIQYASRSTHSIRSLATEHNLRRALGQKTSKTPLANIDEHGTHRTPAMKTDKIIDIVHVIYHPSDDQISESDAEFSRPSIAERRAAGYTDINLALSEAPWLKEKPEPVGTMVHRVKRGYVSHHEFL